MHPSGSSPPKVPADSASFSSLLDHFLESGDPALDLLHAIHTQSEHSVHDCLIANLSDRGAPEDHPAQLRRQRHDFVQSCAPLVSGPAAGLAAGPFHERELPQTL